LAIGLFVIFALFLVVPPLRDFYGLVPLRQPADYLFVAFVVVIWVFVLRSVWKARLFERYFDLYLSWAGGTDVDDEG
jgi:hypothetical protein